MKRLLLIFPWILVLLLSGIFLIQEHQRITPSISLPKLFTPSPKPTFGTSDTFLVTRVIDGDTIEIAGLPAQAGGKKLRYIGIDTPETGECLGDLASEKNRELVLGKEVRLEKDISETDKYGRLLRYVYIGELFVNEELVRAGFAKVSTFPPDVKYQEKFLLVEREARKNEVGLWSKDACRVEGAQSVSNSVSQAGCVIKGNISVNGEKIYHLPGCGSYEKTRINEENGERWFCSEEEAGKAGWRKAKNCP